MILTIGIGARQSFGIFQKPIAAELGVGRELWSFANALSMLLMGVLSPFVGNIADRFGTARTVAAGGVVYVAGILTIAAASEGVMLTTGNILCGIGTAAAGFGPILGAISRQTPATHRSIALGVATAGGSFGQFAIVPFASLLQHRLDSWHATMAILGAVSVLMVPLALGLRESRRPAANAAPGRRGQGTGEALREALRTPGFWLLTIGFFVCGFHVTFIGLHLPSYIADNAVGMNFLGAPDFAAGTGRLGDRPGRAVQHRRRADLGLARRPVSEKGHAGAALCVAGGGVHRVSGAAAVLGVGAAVRRLARVSVARHGAADIGLVGYMFGPTHMAMLWGIVFFSHQLGSFFGGWGAGRLYDVQGQLRRDVVDLGRARRSGRPASLADPRAAGAASRDGAGA